MRLQINVLIYHIWLMGIKKHGSFSVRLHAFRYFSYAITATAVAVYKNALV